MASDPNVVLLARFLREVHDIRLRIAALEATAVELARTHGATWEQIGEEMGGISRQAARARWGQPRPRRRNRDMPTGGTDDG